MTCHRCPRPATLTDSQGREWCMACVAQEGALRRPYASVAIEALEVLGYDDLAREVKRRQAVLEGPLPFDLYAELTQ